MAGTAYTDISTSNTIINNPFLAGMASFYGNIGGVDRFRLWDSTSLTYDLRINEANPDGTPTGVWTDALTQSIQNALADIEAITNVTFTETNNGSADIDFYYYNKNDGYSGYSYGVNGSGVFMNENAVFTEANGYADGLAYGGINHRTMIHEILHNMGVMHPHDRYANFPGVTSSGDTGDFALNQNIYTVMSYNRVQQYDDEGNQTTGWPWTASTVDQSFGVLGAFDIAIMQVLYGANMGHATGNDTYTLPAANGTGTFYKAIWDAGGIDEIVYGGINNAVIDLRAATLDLSDGMLAGGLLSTVAGVYGGFTIAYGVVIENASTGDGDDNIQGNKAGNHLIGNGGKDTLNGRGGKDTLEGGARRDKLFGGAHNDTLDGGGGNDVIKGGGGRDLIIAGNGSDKLFGGNGNDTFVFDGSDGINTIRDFADTADRISLTDGYTYADVIISPNGGDAMITFANTTIILEGVDSSLISITDFI